MDPAGGPALTTRHPNHEPRPSGPPSSGTDSDDGKSPTGHGATHKFTKLTPKSDKFTELTPKLDLTSNRPSNVGGWWAVWARTCSARGRPAAQPPSWAAAAPLLLLLLNWWHLDTPHPRRLVLGAKLDVEHACAIHFDPTRLR